MILAKKYHHHHHPYIEYIVKGIHLTHFTQVIRLTAFRV